MSTIVIAHARFGEGHKKAAEALSGLPGSTVADLLDFAHPALKKVSMAGYLFLTQRLGLLWLLMFLATKNKLVIRLTTYSNRFFFRSFLNYLRTERPHTVISTHFFVAHLASMVKKELGFRLVTVVTDLRAHPLWVDESVDAYCVASQETKNDLLRLGVRASAVTDGVVPVREGFVRPADSGLRQRMKLEELPGITFVSSLRGVFPFLTQILPELLEKYNVFVIYGGNRTLGATLASMNHPRLRAFPFYEKMWELFALSSVIVTKPGGLTVFEGLFMKKYFVFTHYIHGQECQNLELLTSRGVARHASSAYAIKAACDHFCARSHDISGYPFTLRDLRSVMPALIAPRNPV